MASEPPGRARDGRFRQKKRRRCKVAEGVPVREKIWAIREKGEIRQTWRFTIGGEDKGNQTLSTL